MKKTPFGRLPVDHGVRSAARVLGISHAYLSVKAREDERFAPDRARMDGGEFAPMWSDDRLKEIKRDLRKSQSR